MKITDLVEFKNGYMYVHDVISWIIDILSIVGLILDVSGVFYHRVFLICGAITISRFFWSFVQRQNKGGLVNWILRYD